MTDEHENDPRTDPEEDARIRALLADLGSERAPDAGSMPPEVAARLDETLAGLVAERAETGESADSNVVPLRRRWSSRATAAAAAVIVLGVGGVAVANLDGFAGSDDKSTSAGGGVAADSQAESEDSGGDSGSADPEQPSSGLLSPDVPALTAASFDAQVTRLVAAGEVPAPAPANAMSSERKSDASGDDAVTDTAKGGCPGPATKDGSRHTTVMYDGSPAALVVHPPRDGTRLVEAWTCTGAERLDSTRIPAALPTSGGSPGQSSPGDPGLGSPTPTP